MAVITPLTDLFIGLSPDLNQRPFAQLSLIFTGGSLCSFYTLAKCTINYSHNARL